MTSDIKQARTHLGEVYGSEDPEKYLTRCASVATAHALLAIHDLLDERLPARQRIVTLGLGNLDALKHTDPPTRERTPEGDPAERGYCGCLRPDYADYSCTKPPGHAGPHGYAGVFWWSQPDPGTVTLRRDDVEAVLNHGALTVTQRAEAIRRVREALGGGPR